MYETGKIFPLMTMKYFVKGFNTMKRLLYLYLHIRVGIILLILIGLLKLTGITIDVPSVYSEETPAAAPAAATPAAAETPSTPEAEAAAAAAKETADSDKTTHPQNRRRGRRRVKVDPATAAQIEALKEGTVPDFNAGSKDKPFSPEEEDAFYQDSIQRREESLAPFAPLKLRRYARYLIEKYDKNGDGRLQESEWKSIKGAQAMDTDGDFVLREDEILFYITRYSKDRTIFRPNPPVPVEEQHLVVADSGIMIRPLSAPYKSVNKKEAEKIEAKKGLADISEAEFKKMMEQESSEPKDAEKPADKTAAGTTQPAAEKPADSKDTATKDAAAKETAKSDTEKNGENESDGENAEKELLEILLKEDDNTQVREFTVPPSQLKGMPRWFILRDLNGDGQLTLREFAPFLSLEGVAFFGRLDLNGDGFITPDEFREFQKKIGVKPAK